MAAARAEAGLTLDELGELCGVSRQAVHQWENAVTLPQVDKLPVLIAAVDCTYDDLLGPV